MTIKIRVPRIFGCAILTGLIVLGHTFGYAQSGPAATAQSQLAGQQVQLEGELEIVYQDFRDGHSRALYALKQADGSRVPLQFSKNPPTHLLTGDHVRVSGQRSGSGLMLYSGSTNVSKTTGGGGGGSTTTTTPSIPVPNTFGVQSVLVILVNFQDDAVQPYTVAEIQNTFFGATNSANAFVSENSYGQTSLMGAVVGWYTIPESVTTCNTSQIATDVQNAAIAAGVNLANYNRYVYLFPYNSVCGWAGSSYVGGNPSQSWINAIKLDLHTIDHELGHAFGLWHSHLFDCGTTSTICSSPNVVEYGDILDTMGAAQTASPDYNAFQKERLGWLNYGVSPSIQTIASSGTYTIYPYELGGVGPNAIKILMSTDTTGAKTWYYLEARQSIGFDAFLTSGVCQVCYTENETSGVLFHVGTDGNGDTGDLLDMTPSTPTAGGWFDPSLAIGQSFQDSGAGVGFSIESATLSGAVVNVQFSASSSAGSPTGTPALVVATNQGSYSPGQTASISATATYGGSPVANASIAFAVTKADGSQVTGSATTGRNGVAVYKLKLKQTDPPGTYMAGAAASVKGNALSAVTNFKLQ